MAVNKSFQRTLASLVAAELNRYVRRFWMSRSSIFSVVVSLMVLFAENSAACSCIAQSADEKIASADRIVLAEIKSLEYQPEQNPIYPVRATFTVIESLKGRNEPAQGVAFENKWGIGTCSLSLMVGHQFVLFLDESQIVSSCDGSFFHLEGNVPSTERLNQLRVHLQQ